eukprot:scaffold4291_cov76-Skeletonema_dohrnii-CCMP3373.AAC.5
MIALSCQRRGNEWCNNCQVVRNALKLFTTHIEECSCHKNNHEGDAVEEEHANVKRREESVDELQPSTISIRNNTFKF